VRVFSRNQEDNTNKYPDIVRRMQTLLSGLQESVTSAVIDSEAVAWDRQQNCILPFQELSKRKRKVLFPTIVIFDICLNVYFLCPRYLARGLTMAATNHDDQLGEIYPAMLNELNCTFGVSCSRFRCCGHRGHGLWPSWYRPVGTQDVDVGCTLAHLSFCQRVVLVVVLMMSPSDYLPIWGGGTDVPKR